MAGPPSSQSELSYEHTYNILNTFKRVMIILILLLLLTNLRLKLNSTQGTGADKLLSTQRVKVSTIVGINFFLNSSNSW